MSIQSGCSPGTIENLQKKTSTGKTLFIILSKVIFESQLNTNKHIKKKASHSLERKNKMKCTTTQKHQFKKQRNKSKAGSAVFIKVTVYWNQLVLWSSPQVQFLPSISCVLPCPPVSCGSPVCVSQHIIIISPAYAVYKPGLSSQSSSDSLSPAQLNSHLPTCSVSAHLPCQFSYFLFVAN